MKTLTPEEKERLSIRRKYENAKFKAMRENAVKIQEDNSRNFLLSDDNLMLTRANAHTKQYTDKKLTLEEFKAAKAVFTDYCNQNAKHSLVKDNTRDSEFIVHHSEKCSLAFKNNDFRVIPRELGSIKNDVWMTCKLSDRLTFMNERKRETYQKSADFCHDTKRVTVANNISYKPEKMSFKPISADTITLQPDPATQRRPQLQK